MYESGYYPPGAEYDPRAPWNEKEPNMVKCESCNDKGYHWYAYNIETDKETECTEETVALSARNRRSGRSQETTLLPRRKRSL